MVELLQNAFTYASTHTAELFQAFQEHLELVGVALGISFLVSIPLGIWTSRSRIASLTIINFVNGMRVIPSIAVLFLAIPFFGLTFTSAAIALTILALPPVLINTDAAYRTIDPAVLESAKAMGMTPKQTLFKVETPLAIPVILTGLRTAAVEVIASATLAAFIGIGGLGLYVVRGFTLYDNSILLVGAIPIAALALLTDILMGKLQNWLQPPT